MVPEDSMPSLHSMHTHMNLLRVKRTSGKLAKIKSLYWIPSKHAVCQVKGSRIKGVLGWPGTNRMEQRLVAQPRLGELGNREDSGRLWLHPPSCLLPASALRQEPVRVEQQEVFRGRMTPSPH